VRPEHAPNPIKNYVVRTCADTRKAEGVLGFSAKVFMGDGIRRTAEYYGGQTK